MPKSRKDPKGRVLRKGEGYRKDKGMTTDKIMRILNAVYKRMTELNDEPPMPEDVFKERKEMIKAAWEGKMVLD